MTLFRIALVLGLGLGAALAPRLALAQSVTGAGPISGRAVSGDAVIVAGGTAQTLFGGVRPVHGWSVGNPNATDDLWCSDSATAAVNGAGSYRIAANGGLYETPDFMVPGAVVSCVGPTTGDKITARRW